MEILGIGIYRIVAPSGSCYIGMTTKSFKERWANHRKELRNGRHKCLGLKRAFAKYGEENLKFEILEIMPNNSSDSDVLLRERDWWDKFHSDGINIYNGRPSGTGSVHHTEETKRRIGLNQPNRKYENTGFCKVCGNAKNKHRDIYCSIRCSAESRRGQGKLSSIKNQDVLNLIENKLTLHQIKDHFGISIGSAHKLVHRVKSDITD